MKEYGRVSGKTGWEKNFLIIIPIVVIIIVPIIGLTVIPVAVIRLAIVGIFIVRLTIVIIRPGFRQCGGRLRLLDGSRFVGRPALALLELGLLLSAP